MIINGLQKTTLLDYPGKIACIIFTKGCNYNCKFCQNSGLISYSSQGIIPEEDIFAYLQKRKNVLEGVVISGGEPTIQKDLYEFIKKIKSYNLQVKLDTNGTNFGMLKKLIDEHLVDYVAMDIKTTFEHYPDISGVKQVLIENIRSSINLLKNSQIDHEFRTTVMKNYHNIENLKQICQMIGPNQKYYLQKFVDSDGVLDKSLIAFSDEELKTIKEILMETFPKLLVRGI